MTPVVLHITDVPGRQEDSFGALGDSWIAPVPETVSVKVASVATPARYAPTTTPERLTKSPNALRYATKNQSAVKA